MAPEWGGWHIRGHVETKVSRKTRNLDDPSIVAEFGRRPENKYECSTVAAYKSGELDLYHRLAMSPMMCIRISFGRSGVERGAANV